MREQTMRRLRLLAERCATWNDAPQTMPVQEREEIALMMAATLPRFREFAEIGMRFLGFTLTDMQGDIADSTLR